jgi:Holliday junction resolvasome RuvABC DNA-binding subunit
VDLGYTAPAVANMMKEYSASTPEQKKKLSDKLLTDDVTKRKANEDKYKVKGEPGAPKTPKTAEEFKEALVNAGYKEPALGEMMKAYNAAGTDEAKQALSDKLLTNSGTKKRANIKEYEALAAGDTTAGVGSMTKADLDAKLKGLGYNDAARKRMIDHWEKTTDPKEKKTLQDKMLSDANKATYVTRYSDGGQVPLLTGEKASLDNLLKKRGYDDATRKKMLDAWEKANNVDRDIIYKAITSEDADQIAKNKTQYGPNGTGAPPPTDLTGE